MSHPRREHALFDESRLSHPRHQRSLFDEVCSAENLMDAWVKVRAAHGAAGIDHVSIAAFERRWQANLARLAHELREGTYRPQPALSFTLRKPDGGARRLGLLTIRDRVAQRAVYEVIAPLFEQRFLDCSYAYRPGRNTAMAIDAVLEARRHGYVWVVDADIASFFDTLDHRVLVRAVGRVVTDPRIMDLIRLWLDAGVLAAPVPPPRSAGVSSPAGPNRRRGPRVGPRPALSARGATGRRMPAPPALGTIQGAVLSPLLANAYLHAVDVGLSRHYPRLVRYADDLVILCRTQAEAADALRELRVALACVYLRLAAEKTDIHHVDVPFRFLGYDIADGRATMPTPPARVRPAARTRWASRMGRWPGPRSAVSDRRSPPAPRSSRRRGATATVGRAVARKRRLPWRGEETSDRG